MQNNEVSIAPFKKGQSGNPAGRPKGNPELDALKHMNLKEFSEWTQRLWRSPIEDIERLVADKNNAGFVHMLGQIFLKIARGGSAKELSHLLPYIVGKPKDTIQHELPEPVIIHRRDGSSIELGVKQGGDPESDPQDS